MGIIDKALSGAGGYFNLVFLFIFLVLTILFFINLFKKKHYSAFICFLFIIPIAIKSPNIYTIYESKLFSIPVNEGISFYSIFLILFIISVRKDKHFLIIFNILAKKKLLLIGLITAASFGISQQLALPVNFGFLLGYTKIIDPFIFTIITAYIFFKYNKKIEATVIWIILSIFYSTLFSLISGLTIKIDYAGVLRFGGGSIGSATISAAIFVTWAIISIGVFLNSNSTRRKFILVIMFGLLSFLALMTHTRGPLGYFLLGLVLLSTIYPRPIRIKLIINMFIIIPIVLLTLWRPISNEILKRDFNLSNIRQDGSFSERISRNAAALESVIKSPLVGLGFANPPRGSKGMEEYEMYFYVYNTPLAWATFGGIFSGIGFILINIIVFKFALKKSKYLIRNNIISGILKVVLICWFIDYFTTANEFLFGFPFSSVVYYYLVLGIIIGNFVYINAYDRSIRSVG